MNFSKAICDKMKYFIIKKIHVNVHFITVTERNAKLSFMLINSHVIIIKIIYIAVIGFSAELGIRRYHALTAKVQLQFISEQ